MVSLRDVSSLSVDAMSSACCARSPPHIPGDYLELLAGWCVVRQSLAVCVLAGASELPTNGAPVLFHLLFFQAE